MDPRRLLILTAASLFASGCTHLGDARSPDLAVEILSPPLSDPEDDPVVPVEPAAPSSTERPYQTAEASVVRPAPATARVPTVTVTGREAISAANAAARATSRSDGFVGGVQVFAWSPGRVFEVWTAPLRVTTLTLAPGETILSKAAGDTVRWQIGEATSGAGAVARTHVMLKPLQRGLETNLVLTTDRRVYLIDLKSGAADAFNAAVAWDAADVAMLTEETAEVRVPDPVVRPEGPLDGRYRIEPQGRRPRWTPTSVFNDGRRTFITFDADLQIDEAPVLFVIAPDGQAQMVNYRQVGGLFVVDRVFDRAELRLGDRRPQVVRIRRLQGDRS